MWPNDIQATTDGHHVKCNKLGTETQMIPPWPTLFHTFVKSKTANAVEVKKIKIKKAE